MILAIATHNRDKIREIKAILQDLPVEVRTLDHYPHYPEPEENSDSLEGNALIKCKAMCAHTGLAAIADDTGLEVDALDGRPGVYSSRYAGSNADYESNVHKLLEELSGVPDAKRTARFRCVIALSFPQGVTETVEGTIEGMITKEPHGLGGFGYDPVFVPIGFTQTFAEMSAEEKNRLSHRGLALSKMKEKIRALLHGSTYFCSH